MEFSASQDIKAPIEQVFAIVSDLEAMERQATRHGVDLRRMSGSSRLEAGMRWQADFVFRGRTRRSDIALSEVAAPHRMVFDGETGGLTTRFTLELHALSETRTRVTTNATLSPKTLSARLLVQSMKLAKGKIARRYDVRMSQVARDVEERAARLA